MISRCFCALLFTFCVAASPEPPTPTPRAHADLPGPPTAATPPPDKSDADWWMVRLTGAIVFIGAVQTIVFGLQARRLKQTISKMDEISAQQAGDVRASIAEAARAAQAMQEISKSLAISAESVKESVEVTKAAAERQKLISELQSRAYLAVNFDSVTEQNPPTETRLEVSATIKNRGATPASDVRAIMVVDSLPWPLPADNELQLPAERQTGPHIGPGLEMRLTERAPQLYTDVAMDELRSGRTRRLVAWGRVEYKDAFGTERYVDFSATWVRNPNGSWRSHLEDLAHNRSS